MPREQRIKPVVYLTGQRLGDICKQFEKMTGTEKQVCLKIADEKCPGGLIELYKNLQEYMK